VWMIAANILSGVMIAMVEGPRLIRAGEIRQSIFFFTLLGCGVILGILLSLRIPLPNPLDGITVLHKPISEMLNRVLK